jgi:hypothetical protein
VVDTAYCCHVYRWASVYKLGLFHVQFSCRRPALARSLEALSEIVDVVRRLLVANAREISELELRSFRQSGAAFFNAPSFAYLVQRCQNLKALTLERIALDENRCRVLGDFSKPGLEIELRYCRIIGAAAAVLAQILGRNQGPTKLVFCHVDNAILADGLRGNSRLKSLRLYLSNNHDVGNREVLAVAGALRENKGLVDLDLTHYNWRVSEYTWDAVCDSLKTHLTLQFLKVLNIWSERGFLPPLTLEQLKSPIQLLVDMLKLNTSIHTIQLDRHYYEHELFRGSIIPHLETNRLRPRHLAIQEALPIAYRAKVLGRALLAVRTDHDSLWMLLSGNTDIAFSIDDCDDHADYEPPSACYSFYRSFQCCWCCRYRCR